MWNSIRWVMTTLFLGMQKAGAQMMMMKKKKKVEGVNEKRSKVRNKAINDSGSNW
jgi:hypothetical protein